jgi:prepilin-type N-terminal cleavage/methylation domain-containing protein
LNPPKTDSDGFTLVELLVAITIFSLVVGMAMYSLRFAFGVFRHLDAPFAEETQRISRLRDCVASTFMYVGERSGIFNQDKVFFTYFYGEPDRMTFISTKPLAVSGVAICRLSLRNGAIILEEAPLYADDNNYLEPTLKTKESKETSLFPNVKGLTLEYYQGGKKTSTLKEDFPTLVRIAVSTDAGEQEYFCRIQTDFANKKMLVTGLHEPI